MRPKRKFLIGAEVALFTLAGLGTAVWTIEAWDWGMDDQKWHYGLRRWDAMRGKWIRRWSAEDRMQLL